MKKTLYQLGMVAAVALAFTACNKKEEDTGNTRADEIHYATITLGKDVDTKTSVVEGEGIASYRWCDNDDQYLKIYENGVKGEIQSFTLNADKTQATLVVSFTGGSAPYTYEALYAKDMSGAKNPKIQSEQSPTATSFDPAADIMVSQVKEAGNTRLTNLSFKMGRIITVNKMTLTGLEAGEMVSKVEFTLDKSSVWGYISPDANGGYKVTNGGNKLTINYENDTAPVGLVSSEGTFPVYFVSAPVENAAIASVVVTTDKNVYTKAGNADGEPFYGRTISFAVGTMTRFNMDMANYGTPIGEEIPYNKVEDDAMIRAGAEYLFVGPKSDKEICAAGTYDSSYYTAVDVTDTDNVIFIQGEQVMVFTLEAGENEGQFYIQDSEGYYLYWSSGNSVSRNTAKGDSAYLWSISLEDGIVNVKTTDRVLQYNASNPRFACYTGTQKAITLYVNEATLVELADPELEFEGVTDDPIEVAWANRNNFVAPTLSNPYEVDITWTSEDTDVATVDANGAITFVGNGTTTITATSKKTSEFYAGSASYKLKVTGAPAPKGESADNPFTPAEAVTFIQGLSSTPTDKEYYVSGIVTSLANNGQFSTTYGNASFFISEDGSSSSQEFEAYRVLYLGNRAWQEGDELIGVGDKVVVCGRLHKYVSGNKTTYETYAATGNNAYNGYLVSLEKVPFFTAELSENTIGYTGGNLTLSINANVSWSASINNGGSLKIGDASAAASVSGTAATEVTVIIPQKTAGGTYNITFSTTSDKVTAPEALVITQNAQGDDPKGSETNPYTASEARAQAIAGNTSEVYVIGIVTSISTPYSSQFNNVTFTITDNGVSGSDEFTVFRAAATSADTYTVGDWVKFKGTLTYYNNTLPEFTQGPTLIAQIHAPTFTPNGGNFTANSQSVTISADSGAEIRYTTGNTLPTATTGTLYSDAIVITETTTINAIAIKDGIATGVVSKTFTKGQTSTEFYQLVTNLSDITEGTYVVGALRSTSASNNFYFGKASVSSGDWVVSDGYVTIPESDGIRAFSIDDLPTGAVEFTLTGDNTNGFTISNNSKYLYFTAASNRKLAFGADGSSYKWTVKAEASPLLTGGVYFSAVGTQAYTISENSTQAGAIRGYANTTSYRAIYLFKKVSD